MAELSERIYFSPKHPSDVDKVSIVHDGLDTGETIQTSVWASQPAGLTLASPGISGATATVWVSGGVVDQDYEISNTITTSTTPARQRTRTGILPVRAL